MVRILGFLVGLGFVGVAAWSFGWGVWAVSQDGLPHHAEHEFHKHPNHIAFSFEGPFGTYNEQQLQRGFQVYREVCAACHGLNLVAFRNLEALGYSEAEVRAIADQWPIQVPSIDPNTGEAATRAALPADRFPDPYPNETAARAANNNALPPDLSLIVKARHGGAEYIQSLLLGYQEPPQNLPPELRPGQGLHYNPYFPNLNIAMPPPITADGQVTYAQGNPPPTRQQMAHDVSAFLAWTAEPNLESRHQGGIMVLVFLIFATVLAWMAYKNVWASAKRKVRITGPLDPENIARREEAERDAGVVG